MVFILVSIIVPILTIAITPRLLRYERSANNTDNSLLFAAAFLFFISWYVPSPELFGQQTAASTHFIGGGIFAALIWAYVIRRMEWNKPWFVELASLYALVSMLGVTNEIFELIVVRLGLAGLSLTDTSIDLLVNTVGAATGYVVYKIAQTLVKE